MFKNLTFLMIAVMASQTYAVTLQDIKNHDSLRVGVSGTKPPLGFVGGADGDSIGFEPTLARAIAEDLLGDPNKVDFVLLESPERISALTENKVDFVLANFSISPSRAEKVDFANPYLKAQIGVVSPKNAPITDIAQLNGKTLVVSKGTLTERFFKEQYPEIHLQVYDDNAASFINFRKGTGDALAHANTLLFPWAEENPDFEVTIAGIGDIVYVAPAVQKGDTELLNFLNEEMQKLREDGRLDAAYDKYIAPAFGKNAKKSDILIF